MKLNIIKNKSTGKLLNSDYKYHKYLDESRKLILVLENEYEFLDLWNTQKYFYRIPIKNYDIDPKLSNEDKELVKNTVIPVVSGFNLNYIGNFSISIISILDKFPQNKNIGLVKILGPGEIDKNNNLIPYENLEYLLINYCNCKTFTYWYYVDWLTNSKYNNLMSKYPSKLIDKNYIGKKLNDELKDVVTVLFFDYFKKSFKYNEYYSLPARLFLIVMGLKILKKGGDLFLPYFHTRYLISLQVLFKVSTLFESYEFIETVFESNRGYYIFRNFKGNDNILENVLIEYYKLDETLGEKTILDSNINNNLNYNFDIKISDKFFEFMKKISNKHLDLFKKEIQRCEYIKKEINKNPRFISKVFASNIEIAINYAKKYNLKLNPYYKNYFYKLTSTDYKKILFPKANIDYSKLKMTYESTYSVTLAEDADIISKLIIKKYPNTKTIADMTANVGGNSLSFCKYFDYVYSIEYDKETSIYLKNNLSLYGFKNFEVLNIDANKFNKKVDFYFYDPPWTGIFYKMNVRMSLFLGNKNIVDILKPNFCLKAPMNFDIAELMKKFKYISIYKIKNYLIIINNPKLIK